MKFIHYEMPDHMKQSKVLNTSSKQPLCEDPDRAALTTKDVKSVNCPKCKDKLIFEHYK